MEGSHDDSGGSSSRENLDGARRPMTECQRIAAAVDDVNSRVHEAGAGSHHVHENTMDSRPRMFTYSSIPSAPMEQNVAGEPLPGPVIQQPPTGSPAEDRFWFPHGQHHVVGNGSASYDANIDPRLQFMTPGHRFYRTPRVYPSRDGLPHTQAPVARMWPTVPDPEALIFPPGYAVEGTLIPPAPGADHVRYARAMGPSPSSATQPSMPSIPAPQPPAAASNSPTTSDQSNSRAGARDPNGHYHCTKRCSGGLQPFSAFTRSSQPYGDMKDFSHCNECVRKYRKGHMDIATFNALYKNPDPARHQEWKEAEQRRKEEEKREKEEKKKAEDGNQG